MGANMGWPVVVVKPEKRRENHATLPNPALHKPDVLWYTPLPADPERRNGVGVYAVQ